MFRIRGVASTLSIAMAVLLLVTIAAQARPPAREPDYSSMTRQELFQRWNDARDLKALLRYMSFRSFPPDFRIGIVDGRDEAVLYSERPMWVTGSRNEITVQPGSSLTFRPAAGNRPAEILYQVIVKDFSVSDNRADMQVMQDEITHWEQLGYPVDIISIGMLLENESGEQINDNRKKLLSVAFADSREEAERVRLEIEAEYGVVPYIYEKLAREPQGRIHVFVDDNPVFTSDQEIKIQSAGLIEVKQVKHGIGYPWQGYEDRRYRGSMIAAVARNGKLCLVNKVRLELYLMGVVPSEISSSAEMAALKVQAIAARGESLAKYGVRHTADPFHLCAEQHCQVYSGVNRETTATNSAVLDTAGKIIRYEGTIVDAVYSANCGGFTENCEMVWTTTPKPYLVSVSDLKEGSVVPDLTSDKNFREWIAQPSTALCSDPAIALGDRHRWERRFTAREVDDLVAARHPEVGQVKQIIPGTRGRSGRIWDLRIVGDRGEVTIFKELPMRLLLGGLRSGAFYVDMIPDDTGNPAEWFFKGGGWGHGVGMCQHGTMARALKGQTADEILTHYFQNATVEKVY